MVRCDIGDVVQLRVMRSVASPFHSVMREERTRHEVDLERGRVMNIKTASAADGVTMRESSQHYLCFPQQNTVDVRRDLGMSSGFSTVTLVGGAGYFARFIADQCLRRGISVTVLARDVDRAKDAFASLHKRSVATGAEVVEEHHVELVDGDCRVRHTYRARGKTAGTLQLEIVQGDVTSPETVRRAVRQSSLVMYLASAKCSRWWRPWARSNTPNCGVVDVDGLRHTIEACSLVDAHLVAFVPLFNRSSWTSPLQWYRAAFVHRLGYLRATRKQERLLMNNDGSPSALCVQHGGPMRFTLFRVSDMVYPSLNDRVTIAKNNNISDVIHVVRLCGGDLDAKILANIVLRAVALCRSSIGSRLDVTGHMRRGVDLAHVDALLHTLRHE